MKIFDKDPVHWTSLLLLDKDLLHRDVEDIETYDSSVSSEISSSCCGNGCGTSDERIESSNHHRKGCY